MKAKIFRKAGFSGYVCACGERHTFSAYAIGQAAMGHDLFHSCGCGRRNMVVSTQTVLLGDVDPAAARVVLKTRVA